MEEEFEPASEVAGRWRSHEPGREPDRIFFSFVFSFCFFLLADWGEERVGGCPTMAARKPGLLGDY